MDKFSNWAPLPLRLGLGVVFWAHGAQKAFGWFGGPGFGSLADQFHSYLRLPVWLTALVVAIEFLGGAALVLGFRVRWAAAALAAVMAGAIWKVHLANGFFLNWANIPGRGHGVEYNVVILSSLFCIILSGSGPLSLDGKK